MQFWPLRSAQFDVHIFSKRNSFYIDGRWRYQNKGNHIPPYQNLPNLIFYFFYLTNLPRQLEPHLLATGNYGSGSYFPYVLTNLGQWPLAWYSGHLLPNAVWPMVASSNQVKLLFWAICLSTPTACRAAKLCTGLLTAAKITRHLLTVYQTRSNLNICRQMALFEMVQTLILRFANMEKWINSLNLSTLIFRTLQYIICYIYAPFTTF